MCPFCQQKFNNISPVVKHVSRFYRKESEYEPDRLATGSSSLWILSSPSEMSLSGLLEEPQEDNEQDVEIPLMHGLHVCWMCRKTFNRKDRLKLYIEVHTAEPKYLKYGRRFKRKHDVTNHLTANTCFRTHKCPVCGKQLLNHDNMTKHIRASHLKHDNEAKARDWHAEEDAAMGMLRRGG